MRILFCVLFLFASSECYAAGNKPVVEGDSSYYSGQPVIQEMARLINQKRGRPVFLDERMTRWAQIYANRTVGKGLIHSKAPQRYGYAEILTQGRNPRQAMRIWQSSPAHMNIMRNRGTKMGIGFARSGNRTFWIVVFK